MTTPASVAVVGAGASGCLTAMHLARSAAREATSEATDYLNAAFGSALTVKVTG